MAVAWGLGELIYTKITTGKFDGIIIADTALLMLMGAVSVIFHNELFFKLKPAVFEGIFAVYLFILIFSSEKFLQAWLGRYMKGMTPDIAMIKKMFTGMSVLFLLHAGAIAYTAVYSDKKTWLFVNGALLYIVFGALFIGIFIKRFVFSKKPEFFPVLDAEGKIVGKATRDYCHGGSFALHPVVHIHLFNEKSELLLQKRSMRKEIQPGKWDTSVGGHIMFGEKIEDAVNRECKEEIGFVPKNIRFLYKYRMKSSVEEEVVFTYSAVYDNERLRIQKSEIDEAVFLTPKAIRALIDKQETTENFILEFELLRKNKVL